MFLSVIISSYNDESIIRPYFQAIHGVLAAQTDFDWELVYVDDGSTDGSVETLNELAAENSLVTVIQLARNFGQQKAFLAGMKWAKGDVIVTLDGDFQYPPTCILDLAAKIHEGNDIVSGVRIRRKDRALTRYTSRAGQVFIRKIFQVPVQDFGSVKAFSRFITDQIIQHENYCTNVYGLAYALTNRHAEIPVEHLPRYSGSSKWNFTKRLHLYFDLYLAYSPYESTFLLKAGFVTAMLGFSYLSLLLYLFMAHGLFYFRTFTAGLSLGLMVVGLFLSLGSFFFSFLLRIYRQLLWKGHCYIERQVIPAKPEEARIHVVGDQGGRALL